jgi:hypothetical protein
LDRELNVLCSHKIKWCWCLMCSRVCVCVCMFFLCMSEHSVLVFAQMPTVIWLSAKIRTKLREQFTRLHASSACPGRRKAY